MSDKIRKEFEKWYFDGCDYPIELQRDGEIYTTMSATTAYASWQAAYKASRHEELAKLTKKLANHDLGDITEYFSLKRKAQELLKSMEK